MSDFFTSSTGLFATVAAFVALLLAIQNLVRPHLVARRELREAAPFLSFSKPHVTDVAASALTCELRFELVNAGGGVAVVTAISVQVNECRDAVSTVVSVPESPLSLHVHRVELSPDTRVYPVRARTYAPDAPPLSLAAGEAEAFLVKLVSVVPQLYEFELQAEWYDVRLPDVTRALSSESRSVEFPKLL
ncbi:MAG TPA: hypothetical protein VGW38_28980 [Chloroflexota bacterium]|nr:hypothetical protein [Chloroflexota bacterium]